MSNEELPLDNQNTDFREKAVTGIGWNTFGQLYKQGIQIIVGILLARLLTPEAFGLVGMITVLTGFAKVFKDMGFGAALIQKADTDPLHFDTVFWANILLGLCLTLLFAACAPLIAAFYNEPMLIPITIWLSLTFFIDSFGIVHDAIINKKLDFKRLSIMEVLYITIAGGIAIIMAVRGFGVWSLVAHALMSSVASMSILWIISPWRPKMRFSKSALKDLWKFSINLLGYNAINYWFRNSDDLLIGRFFGSSALGIYNRAYSLMLFPLNNITGTISRVMFPAFSTIQDDRKRIGSIYLKITQTIGLITFPMMMGLMVVAEDFVIAVFGPQWSGMIPILQLFSLVGLIHSINTLNGNIFQALGRTDLQLKVGGTVAVLGIIAIIIGLTGGVYGVAVAFTFFTLLAFYPSVRIAISLINLTFWDLILNLKEVFFISLAMAGIVFSIEFLYPNLGGHWTMLSIQVGAGAIVYALMVHFFNIKAYRDVRNLIQDLRNGSSE